MAGFSEEFNKLKIEQRQVEGWIDGTFDTYVTYCDKDIAIKRHSHATARTLRHKIDIAAILFILKNGLNIINQCNFYKNMLDDIFGLQRKMILKMQEGLTYNFDMKFVNESLSEIVTVIHKDVKEIYINLKFEANSNGRQVNIPLPDYTIRNVTETESSQKADITDVAIKDKSQNEILDLIKKDTSLLIELVKELKKDDPQSIIQELIDSLQLKPNPVNGKYLPAGKNDRQLIFWVVEQNYNEYLTQNNYLTFISSQVDPETIKRYFREAKSAQSGPQKA